MEVTLKIEAGQLGETVVDLFKNLSEDQKKEIATDILTKWLNEPYEIERNAYVEGIVSQLRQANVEIYTGFGRKKAIDCTDKEIKESSEYRQKAGGFKSSREVMIKEITNEVITYFKTSIQEQVKTDPQVEAFRGDVYQFIVDNFPMMIKESMVNFFSNHLSSIATCASSAMNDRAWFEKIITKYEAATKKQI